MDYRLGKEIIEAARILPIAASRIDVEQHIRFCAADEVTVMPRKDENTRA